MSGSRALVNINCSGKPSFNAPKYTLNLGAEQSFEYRGYKLTGLIDTQYLSKRYVGFDLSDGAHLVGHSCRAPWCARRRPDALV